MRPLSAPAEFLFLDFDGVLHANFPRRDRTDAENLRWAFVPALEVVLRAHPQVAIVISSTWRRDHPLASLRAKFSPDIAQRIVGVTPLHGRPLEPGARQDEIEAWLRANDRAHAVWVALDDVVEQFHPGACVVVADDGFRTQEALDLHAALADPAGWAAAHPVPAPGSVKTLWVPGA
jgi:hypothetical protein